MEGSLFAISMFCFMRLYDFLQQLHLHRFQLSNLAKLEETQELRES
jgi:hypothetical protein